MQDAGLTARLAVGLDPPVWVVLAHLKLNQKGTAPGTAWSQGDFMGSPIQVTLSIP
jgi:hypothetical protein